MERFITNGTRCMFSGVESLDRRLLIIFDFSCCCIIKRLQFQIIKHSFFHRNYSLWSHFSTLLNSTSCEHVCSNRSQHCFYQWKLITPFQSFRHVFSRRVGAINLLIYVDRTDKFSRHSGGSFSSYCSLDYSHVAIKVKGGNYEECWVLFWYQHNRLLVNVYCLSSAFLWANNRLPSYPEKIPLF